VIKFKCIRFWVGQWVLKRFRLHSACVRWVIFRAMLNYPTAAQTCLQAFAYFSIGFLLSRPFPRVSGLRAPTLRCCWQCAALLQKSTVRWGNGRYRIWTTAAMCRRPFHYRLLHRTTTSRRAHVAAPKRTSLLPSLPVMFVPSPLTCDCVQKVAILCSFRCVVDSELTNHIRSTCAVLSTTTAH
jgi:hypothetical protein